MKGEEEEDGRTMKDGLGRISQRSGGRMGGGRERVGSWSIFEVCNTIEVARDLSPQVRKHPSVGRVRHMILPIETGSISWKRDPSSELSPPELPSPELPPPELPSLEHSPPELPPVHNQITAPELNQYPRQIAMSTKAHVQPIQFWSSDLTV